MKLKNINNTLKQYLLIIAFVLLSAVTYASDPCNPGDAGCEIDVPLDTHIWVLILAVGLFTLFMFKKQHSQNPIRL